MRRMLLPSQCSKTDQALIDLKMLGRFPPAVQTPCLKSECLLGCNKAPGSGLPLCLGDGAPPGWYLFGGSKGLKLNNKLSEGSHHDPGSSHIE